MSRRYHAVLFDLFGTLITVDSSTLSEITVDGRATRTTLAAWAPHVEAVCPGLDRVQLARTFWQTSAELARARAITHVECPARERFRQTLLRLGCSDAIATATAPALVRAHMQAIAETTRFPAGHRAVLEHAASRGPVAVVTNFDDTAGAYEIMERHGIRRLVTTVVISEAVGLRKPHAALLTMALRDLGHSPEAALMVGDNALEDVGAADAAGVDAAWIDPEGRGTGQDGPRPRWVVRALPDVVPIVEGRAS